MVAKSFSIILTFKMRKLRQMTEAICYSALPQSQSVFEALIKAMNSCRNGHVKTNSLK